MAVRRGASGCHAWCRSINEAAQVGSFLEELHAHVRQITTNVELIVINDGSSDDSAREIPAAADHLPLHYIELSRTFGKEHAIQAGPDATTGVCVLVIDADYQHPICLVSAMVEAWSRGVDMVYGTKTNRDGEGLLRRACAALFYRLLSVGTGTTIPRYSGGFRLIDKRVVKERLKNWYWSSHDLMETFSASLICGLEGLRADTAQVAVPASRIVERLDVLGDVLGR